ncbi:MAG: hypothetical protein HC827_22325 [Cyanobacteria bacterium RM1_2_2]|nr:hypothetical protein [Cyanobacteria bacterium RM1_2_2]
MLHIMLSKRQWYRRLKISMIAFGLAILMLSLSPVQVAHADAKQPKGTTASDLSDIPNLEQMDHDKFEKYVGDVPEDRKPLFNPDNGKSQLIKDKNPLSDEVITPADLKEGQTD